MPRETDADFLRRRAAEARVALVHSTGRAAAGVKRLFRVRPWTNEYPWATIGVAAAAGFLAGAGPLGSVGRRVPIERFSPPRRRPMLATSTRAFMWGVLMRLISGFIRESDFSGPTPPPD